MRRPNGFSMASVHAARCVACGECRVHTRFGANVKRFRGFAVRSTAFVLSGIESADIYGKSNFQSHLPNFATPV